MSKNSEREKYSFSNHQLPLLKSREEEYRLIELIKKGDKEALTQFVTANLRLVISIAKRHARYGVFPLDDLIQEGNIGLMKAIKKFDHKRGNKFSTHAEWWIRRSILRALENKAKTIRTPSHRWQLFFQYKREKMDLMVKGGKKINLNKEIARKMEISEDDLSKLLEEMKDTVSFQKKLSSDDDSGELGDIIEDTKIISHENKVDIGIVSKLVKAALKDLKKEDQQIYRLYFVEDVSPKDMAKIFSCTKKDIKRKVETLIKKLSKNPEILKCKNFLDYRN